MYNVIKHGRSGKAVLRGGIAFGLLINDPRPAQFLAFSRSLINTLLVMFRV